MTHPMTDWSAEKIIEAYLDEMPFSYSEAANKSLQAIRAGNYSLCKAMAAVNLYDSGCKAIGYLSSVPAVVGKGLPTLPVLLAEAARAIVDAWQHQDLQQADVSEKMEVMTDLNFTIFSHYLQQQGLAGGESQPEKSEALSAA